MGNVLRALSKSRREETLTSAVEPVVHIVSMAVASAEQAAREKLDQAAAEGRPADRADQPVATQPQCPAETPVEALRPSADAKPAAAGRFDPLLVVHHRPRCLASEQIRQLRAALLSMVKSGPVRCMITSALPREGKTVTSSNLACCFAEIEDKQTLLIDGDLRSGRLAGLFGLSNDRGLADLLARKAKIGEVVFPTDRPNLHVVPAGQADLDDIGRLLSGELSSVAMQQLMRGYDYVIIDSPPAQDIADAGILGAWASMALMAVRIQQTPRQAVDEACRVLRAAGVNIAGMVALDSQAVKDSRSRYYKYYG